MDSRISNPDVLFHVLSFLLVQLGDPNAALRGTAFVEVCSTPAIDMIVI